ncbi:MAG: threonine synthase, partial [Bacteroidetes bacterium]|nr:threonine synthase [Bacteroidota bacterium]
MVPLSADTYPPEIQLIEPQSTRGIGVRSKRAVLRVRGTVVDDNPIAEFTIDGEDVLLNAGGLFDTEISLRPGVNLIALRAVDRAGNEASISVSVVREMSLEITGDYYAFVIGINEYSGDWPVLKNAVHDASALAEVLKDEYLFDVVTLFDAAATRVNIINQIECVLAGAKVYLVNGLITDCGAVVRGGVDATGWFDCSTLKEPYRIEGKKTMGLELAEQFDWKLPDVILYPTGGGTGLIGMWKAFHELRELGWLKSDTLPRMVAVQSDGCAPIPRAFDAGDRFAEPWEDAKTCASGLRVPQAIGDFMILDAVRESGGWAVSVAESRIVETMRQATTAEGISICPEAATCVLAVERLLAEKRITPDDRIVLF